MTVNFPNPIESFTNVSKFARYWMMIIHISQKNQDDESNDMTREY